MNHQPNKDNTTTPPGLRTKTMTQEEIIKAIDVLSKVANCAEYLRTDTSKILNEKLSELIPLLNNGGGSNIFVADDILGFAEHCRLTGKQCTYDELDKWKKKR